VATSTYASSSRLGPSLTYGTVSDATLRRPDWPRVITPVDGPAFEFYDDGELRVAYAPAGRGSPSPTRPPRSTPHSRQPSKPPRSNPSSPTWSRPIPRRHRGGDRARAPHRPVARGRPHDHGHPGDRGGASLRAELDRRRRRAPAQDPRGIRPRSVATAPPSGLLRLARGRRSAERRLHVGDRRKRATQAVRRPGPEASRGRGRQEAGEAARGALRER